VIASSFPLLAVAYTGMADQMGDEQQEAMNGHEQQTDAIPVLRAETAQAESHHEREQGKSSSVREAAGLAGR
jgi:hypothetical protein